MEEPALMPIADRPASATEQVFRSLYDAVISLQLPPGAKVSEAEVAKQLQVSRQPVRDAFFRLSSLGFLSIRPQRATLITRISETAVLDALFVRSSLEVECLRLALSRRTEADLSALRDNLRQQKRALRGADAHAFHDLDEAFHAALCAIAGHPHAWSLIQDRKGHMDRVRFLTLSKARRAQVLDDHENILTALEAGDARRATRLLRAHLDDIRTVLPHIRAQFPDYFDSADPS